MVGEISKKPGWALLALTGGGLKVIVGMTVKALAVGRTRTVIAGEVARQAGLRCIVSVGRSATCYAGVGG